MKQPRLVIDKNIPYIKGIFEPHGCSVRYLSPKEIDAAVMRQCDVLIIRTRTRCDQTLLEGSPCRIIATATIGTDHIDLAYAAQMGIQVINAQGCNARSVAQYIASCLVLLQQADGWQWGETTLGIVGVGHVGSEVAEVARLLGVRLLLNDPFREGTPKEGEHFVSLETLARESDIITLHTPLTTDGEHPTHHLINEELLHLLKPTSTLINTARGAVVDNRALYEAYKAGTLKHYLLDCWEGEPHLYHPLLADAFVATPHVAGYSADGKSNATRMVVEALTELLHLPLSTECVVPPPPPHPLLQLEGGDNEVLGKALLATYHPGRDRLPEGCNASEFEQRRNHYPLRREYKAYQIEQVSPNLTPLLTALGFKMKED